MTWQESDLRLVRIGERSARFHDLSVSFSQDGDPVESVIWLPNGGGKSSMMSLRSAVVLPNARDFTGAGRDDAGEKRPRRLDDYVATGDTSHTVIAWTADDPQSLFRAPKRLLTGAVYEWPGRQRPADGEGGGLVKTWWRAEPKAGLLDIDEIPVRGSNLLTMSQFKARMVELNTEHPELQIQFFTTQSDWEKELTRLQIDTQLARYQAKMNTSEGGISRVFKFGSTQDFINLVVDVICPPQDAADVSGILNQHAANLFRRPHLLAEQSFLTQASEVLESLRDWQLLVDESTGAVRGAQADARKARLILHRARMRRAAEAEVATKKAEQHDEQELDANRARRRIDRQRTELRRLAARARLAEADRALSEAVDGESDARQTVTVWSVAQHLADEMSHRARADEVLELLKPERSQRDALRVAHDVQAHAVRTLLHRRAREHDEQETSARAKRDTAKANAKTAGEELTSAGRDLLAAQTQHANAKARIDAHQDALAAARADGILADGERPAEAATRHEQVAADGATTVTRLQKEAKSLRDSSKQMRERANQDKRRHGELEAEAGRLREAAQDLDDQRARFAGDPRLAALAEADDVDPWADAPRLRSALAESVRDARARALTQAVEAASDDRLVAAVDSDGYLPAPTATETVIDALRSAGVIAQTAWEVLTRDFPDDARRRAATRRPDVASGVVMQTDTIRQRALTLLASSPTLAHVPLVTIDELTAATESGAAGAPLPAAPLHAGLHDADVAVAAADALRGAGQARVAERVRLTALADNDTKLLDALTQFLEQHPSADSLATAVAAADSHHRAAQRLGAEIAALETEADTAWSRADELAEQARDLQVEVSRHGQHAKAAARLATAAEENQRHADTIAVATQAITDLGPRIEALTGQVAAFGEEAAGRENDRREAERLATQVRQSAARVVVLDDKANPEAQDVASAVAAGLTEAQTRYDTLRGQWQAASSTSVLEERLGTFEQLAAAASKEAEAAVGRYDGDKGAVRTRAKELAAHHDAEACRGHLATSRQHLETQLVAVTNAKSAKSAAQDKVTAAAADVTRAGRVGVDEAVHFESTDQAEAEAVNLDLEHSAAQSRESAEREAEEAQRQRARDLQGEAEQLLHLAGLLPEGDVDDDLTDAFAGSMAQARDLVDRIRRELATAEESATAANDGLKESALKAVKVATRPAYQNLTLTIRDRLAEGDPRALGKAAGSYLTEVDTRLEQLDGLIKQVERDKDRVTSVVTTKVRELLNGISGAARASVLPAGLGDMSGNQFVTIRFDSPTDEELTSRVSQEVLAMLDNAGASVKNLPTGEETLRKCVHAAAGNRKFTVSVLKPNEHMVAQRVPVTDVARFSDGEKLTTCVLLFCAFARMRRRANTAGTATGTLMLDNPFGQASNAQLVALQLAVAKAQQVHLVYATGLEDMGALAQFRRLIRLRNRKVSSGNGFVQPEDHRRTGEVTGVTVSRPDAPAATWQPDDVQAPA